MATRQRNRCNAVIFFPTISAPPRRIGAALTDSAAQCEYCTALLVVHRGNECSPDGLVCDKHPVEGSQCVKKNQQQNKKKPNQKCPYNFSRKISQSAAELHSFNFFQVHQLVSQPSTLQSHRCRGASPCSPPVNRGSSRLLCRFTVRFVSTTDSVLPACFPARLDSA